MGEPLLSRGGFYGQDMMETQQSCDSFNSSQGAYTTETRLANCPVSSALLIKIHNGSEVYGSARSGGTISTASPWGGEVCANFDNGCPVRGETCEGSSCLIPVIEKYESFDTYCRPGEPNQGDLHVTGPVTLVSSGDETWQRCWRNISIAKDGILSLSSTDHPYFFDTLQISSGGILKAAPVPANGYISVFVNKFTADKITGGITNDNKPCQLHLIYLGTDDLSIASSSNLMMRLTAPSALVELKAKFDFFGGVRAKQLVVSNLTAIHYDESCNDRMLSGMKFRLRKQGEVYR